MKTPSNPRKIIHVDMDCFYASVEIREQPHLAEHPVAVGGKASGRGVLTTCNYKAREFGLHSAMPAAKALKLCPDLVLLPVRMDLYREASAKIHAIFRRYTTTIEPLSLDEAYLDVSNSELRRGSATLIAQEIRQRTKEELDLTASAGIASNKFLAKVASDWNKPNGQFAIPPEKVADFMQDLPVKNIPGVGPVTRKRLSSLGIETCGELQQRTLPALQEQFGRFGSALYQFARGEDERPVKSSRKRKSLSIERTFAHDLPDLEAIEAILPELHQQLLYRLEKATENSPLPLAGVFVKLKYHDFRVTTHQRTEHHPNLEVYQELIRDCLVIRNAPVRLVGLGVRFGLQQDHQQLTLL